MPLPAPLVLLLGPRRRDQPLHRRAVDEDDHVPLRRAAVRGGDDRRGRGRRVPRLPHHGRDAAARWPRQSCSRVLGVRPSRGGRRRSARVPRRRVGPHRVPEFQSGAGRGQDPQRHGGEHDLRPRPTPHRTAARSTRYRTRGNRRTSASTASPVGAARRVDWIAVDRNVLDRETSRLLERFIDRGTFHVVFDQDNYQVLRRT